jgi:hypothetical protein
MNLVSDKIKFYTNIIVSGTVAIAPALLYFLPQNKMDHSFFLTFTAIAILLFGRICLELALLVETNLIDAIVECKVKKRLHYEIFEEKDSLVNKNWYGYLKIDNNKAAHEVIAHLADRLLFLLSTSIAAIIGSIFFVLFYKQEAFANMWLFILVFVYVIFSFTRAISLATGLDFLRYYILNRQDDTPVEPVAQGENE